MEIRAIREIENGEEIMISYCDILEPTELRKKTLDKFNFACNCELCENKILKEGIPLDYLKSSLNCKNCSKKKKRKFFHTLPQPLEISFFTHQNSYLYENLEFKCSCGELFDKNIIFQSLNSFSRLHSLLIQQKLDQQISSRESFLHLKSAFHPFNFSFYKFHSNLIDFFIQNNNFSNFLSFLCVDLLEYLEVHSPVYNPIKAISYATAAKILAYNNSLTDAIINMKKAISILTITCKNFFFF
jgi:hypothetical protein